MAKLLYIEASPRKDTSHSLRVARAFLDAYAAAHPGDTIETLDLWAHPLPPFDGATLASKYAVMGGQGFTPEQQAAWARVVAEAERFKAADKIVISTPMWNFGIPYVLKHYLDVIVQPGLTFGWSPEKGYFGLVLGKPAAVIHASMGDYAPGGGAEAIDFEKPYMDWILRFMGFERIEHLRAMPTAGEPAVVAAAVAKAVDAAKAAGATF